MTADEKADAAEDLTEKISAMLVGVDPDIIGGTLADLTSIWLAGHRIVDDGLATAKFRDEILKGYIKLVHRLTKLNAKAMGTDY